MRATGQITSIMHDWKKGDVAMIRLEDADRQKLAELANMERISIELKPYRAKRSLNANSYFHALCDQLAKAQNPPMTPARMKNELIARYGQKEIIDEVPVVIKTNLPIEVMLENETLHTWPAKGGDQNTTYYYVFRGSSTYDTKEMSVLIDGTIEECKLYGIDTKTDRELEEMLERWGHGKDTKEPTGR